MARERTPDESPSDPDEEYFGEEVEEELPQNELSSRRKGGRPSKRDLPVSRESVLLNALKMGMAAEKACDLVGIDSATFRRWKQTDSALDKRARQAKAEGIASLTQVAWDIALSSSSDAMRFRAAKYLLSLLDHEMVERTQRGADEDNRDDQVSDIDFTYL